MLVYQRVIGKIRGKYGKNSLKTILGTSNVGMKNSSKALMFTLIQPFV